MVVDKYNMEDALRHIGEKDYYQFLIVNDNQNIGIVEYQIVKSEIDNAEILYLKDIYIDEKFRGIGIGKKF